MMRSIRYAAQAREAPLNVHSRIPRRRRRLRRRRRRRRRCPATIVNVVITAAVAVPDVVTVIACFRFPGLSEGSTAR